MSSICDRASIAIDRLVFDMRGYTCDAPSQEVYDIDQAVVDEIKCHCKHPLLYMPFWNGIEYHPFTVCTYCGDVKEF